MKERDDPPYGLVDPAGKVRPELQLDQTEADFLRGMMCFRRQVHSLLNLHPSATLQLEPGQQIELTVRLLASFLPGKFLLPSEVPRRVWLKSVRFRDDEQLLAQFVELGGVELHCARYGRFNPVWLHRGDEISVILANEDPERRASLRVALWGIPNPSERETRTTK